MIYELCHFVRTVAKVFLEEPNPFDGVLWPVFFEFGGNVRLGLDWLFRNGKLKS